MVDSGIKENLPRAREAESGGRTRRRLALAGGSRPTAASVTSREPLGGRDYGSPRFYLRISSVPAASCSCSFATSMATKLRSVVLPRDLVHGTRGRDRAGRGRDENSPEENERPEACVVARVLRAGVPIQYKASTSKGSHLCRFHVHRNSPVRLSDNGGCYPQPHRRRAGRARLSSYVSVDSVYKTLGIWL